MKSKATKLISTLLVLCVWHHLSIGQIEKCKNGYLAKPNKISGYVDANFIHKINNGSKSLIPVVEGEQGSRCWTVYSDRANNKLHKSPDGFPEDDQLDFMEMVTVKEIRHQGNNSWLLVYSRVYNTDTGVQRNKRRGWIKANKVLLSNYALLNDQSIPQKSMALYSIDVNKVPEEVNYYYYDQPKNGIDNDGVARKFRIYYVLKSVGPWRLLSKTDKLTGNNVKGDIIGWMRNSKTTGWDHRVCYEPNSGPQVKNRFLESKNYEEYKLPIFDSEDELDFFIKNSKAHENAIFNKYEIKNSRPDPYEMRLPILENIGTNKKHVVSIASLNSNESLEDVDIEEPLVKLKRRKRAVNILFVVDATESMTEYYPSIRNSILKIIENQRLNDAETNLRFGLAIYRDYPDEKDKFDLVPLSGNPDRIEERLRAVETKSADNDLPEAQYQGLVKGIERCGFSKDNSNVVVLVGDAGNHEEDPEQFSKQDVVAKLRKYNASLISFQVFKESAWTYTIFNADAQHYLRSTSESYVPNQSDVNLEKVQIDNTYRLKYPNYSEEKRGLFMFGRFTYASGKEQMDPKKLERSVENSVMNYLNTVENGITILKNIRDGSDEVDPAVQQWLKNHGWSNKQIEKLQMMGEFTKRGFLSNKYYNIQGSDAFKPVVFISRSEKREIDNILNRLIHNKGSITETQKALQNALLEQCKKMLGEKRNEPILNKTLNEIWDIILSVPFSGNSYVANKKLREISTMSKNDFRDFYEEFKESAKEFINRDFNASKFELADQTYYWIPLKEIPGND